MNIQPVRPTFGGLTLPRPSESEPSAPSTATPAEPPEETPAQPAPRPTPGLRLDSLARLKRETRYVIAALLSVLVLVAALVLSSGKNSKGKVPPTTKITQHNSPTRDRLPRDPDSGEKEETRSSRSGESPPVTPLADAEKGPPEVKAPAAASSLPPFEPVIRTAVDQNAPPTPTPAESLPKEGQETSRTTESESPPKVAEEAPRAPTSPDTPSPAIPAVAVAARTPPTPAPVNPVVIAAEPVSEPSPSPAPVSVPMPEVTTAPEPVAASPAAPAQETVAPVVEPTQATPRPDQQTPTGPPAASPQPAAASEPSPANVAPPAPAVQEPVVAIPSAPSPKVETATAEPAPTGNPVPPSRPAPAENTVSGEWVVIPNARTRRAHEADLPAAQSLPDSSFVDRAPTDISDMSENGQVEPVPHVVQKGENFWTISRLYYGTGRYWKALWGANRQKVPAPEKLYVGTTIRVPPPESLDRALVEPPKTAGPAAASLPDIPLRRTSRPVLNGDDSADSRTAGAEHALALPVDEAFEEGPVRETWDDLVPEPEARLIAPGARARRPVYKIRRYDTLRSIARDTLGDARRADEILDLNDDVIDDPRHLILGQIIELPEDARIGRRER